MAPQLTVLDKFAMNSGISFREARDACGWPNCKVSFTDEEMSVLMSVWAMMNYNYATAMMEERKNYVD